MKTTTGLTLRWLRSQDWLAESTERWVARRAFKPATPGAKPGAPGVRKDLFGFCDILAVKLCEHGVLFVQTTSRPEIGRRLAKVKRRRAAYLAVLAGNQVWVVGWRKEKDGGRELWVPKVVELTIEDFDPAAGFDDDKEQNDEK